jgi:hypothetical protein
MRRPSGQGVSFLKRRPERIDGTDVVIGPRTGTFGLHDQALPHGIQHDLGGVMEVQLLHQVRSVRLHGR